LLAPPRHSKDPRQLSEGFAFFLPHFHRWNGGGIQHQSSFGSDFMTIQIRWLFKIGQIGKFPTKVLA
jgi:hypothetical protein